jgi:hypothetical protein
MKSLQVLFALTFAASAVSAKTPSLSPADLEGEWRLSAVSKAKYGCDNPGAMTVRFVRSDEGGLVGTYTGPGMPGQAKQRFVPVTDFGTLLNERDAKGRAITLDAPGALRRIFAVETSVGADGKPARLEWASTFGGFGEDASIFDAFEPSAWLTRC